MEERSRLNVMLALFCRVDILCRTQDRDQGEKSICKWRGGGSNLDVRDLSPHIQWYFGAGVERDLGCSRHTLVAGLWP